MNNLNETFGLLELMRDNERHVMVKSFEVYYKCIKCNGSGIDLEFDDEELSVSTTMSVCKYCEGKGVFDFVENVRNNVKTKMVKNETIKSERRWIHP